MIFKSYAKINLVLDVVKKRKDGYHDLDMVMLPIEIFDSIEIIPIQQGSTHIICDAFDKKTKGYSNTCYKVLQFFNKTYKKSTKYEIEISKEIPISSGLGGGSSNAATLFKALCLTNKITPTQKEVSQLAKKVGADVPFFVYDSPAHVTGIGEKVELINYKKVLPVLIIMPSEGLLTKDVFAKCDKYKMKHYDVKQVLEDLKNDNLKAVSEHAGNSLEEVAARLNPEINEIISAVKEEGFSLCHMSGSGASIFVICEKEKELAKLAKKIKKKFKCTTYLTCTRVVKDKHKFLVKK